MRQVALDPLGSMHRGDAGPWFKTCTWSNRLRLPAPQGQQAQRAQGRRKKTRLLRLPPIGRPKPRARRLVWRRAVEDVVKRSHERPVVARLEKLLAA